MRAVIYTNNKGYGFSQTQVVMAGAVLIGVGTLVTLGIQNILKSDEEKDLEKALAEYKKLNEKKN